VYSPNFNSARSPFCDTTGAEMSDQMNISVYRSQLPKDGGENDSPKFYYKKKKVQTKTDNATQEFLKKQLDLKLKVSLNMLTPAVCLL
jgi:hypothetical protein